MLLTARSAPFLAPLLLALLAMLVLTPPAALRAQDAGGTTGKLTPDITIELENYNQPKAVLAHHFGKQKLIKDTLEVSNGSVRIHPDEPITGGVYLLVLLPSNNYFEFIINEEEPFRLKTDINDPVSSMTIKGSAENKVFYEYIRSTAKDGRQVQRLTKQIQHADTTGQTEKAEKLRNELKAINERASEKRQELIKQHPRLFAADILRMMEEPNLPEPREDESKEDQIARYQAYKRDFLRMVDWQDPRYLRTPVFHNRLMRYFDEVVVRAPDSIIAAADRILVQAESSRPMFQYLLATIMNHYIQSKIMCMDKVYVHLMKNYYLAGKAPWMSEKQRKNMQKEVDYREGTLCGEVAPELMMAGMDKQVHSLHQYIRQHDYTIIYFYSTTCGHCKKQTPKVVKHWKTHREATDKGVGMYTVVTNLGNDKDIQRWQEFVEKHGFSEAQNVGYGTPQTKNFRKLYDIRATPVKLIVDSEGKILAKQLSPAQIGQILSELVKNKAEGEAKDSVMPTEAGEKGVPQVHQPGRQPSP